MKNLEPELGIVSVDTQGTIKYSTPIPIKRTSHYSLPKPVPVFQPDSKRNLRNPPPSSILYLIKIHVFHRMTHSSQQRAMPSSLIPDSIFFPFFFLPPVKKSVVDVFSPSTCTYGPVGDRGIFRTGVGRDVPRRRCGIGLRHLLY